METVLVNDVGPRDGLQNESQLISPQDRVALIDKLLLAGLRAIEVASFVSPKAVPKMTGAAEVVGALNLSDADFSALIPNAKGYALAKQANVQSVAVVLSATDDMNKANINMDLARATQVCSEVMQQARRDGLRARAYVSVAVECPYSGAVEPKVVEDLAAQMFNSGADEVIVADTIGAANPAQIKGLFGRLVDAFGARRLSAHFHDTRALAVANTWQALECGIRKFDASVGGIGGCPFAPGAAGNLATEDLVSLLHQAGFETGIDEQKLRDAVVFTQSLVGHPVGGRSLPWQLSEKSC